MEGREYTEAPDFTARICGICPVAHQITSCRAMEAACGVRVGRAPCAISGGSSTAGSGSKATPCTVFMLHAPDFLGYPDALAMAADHGPMVEAALRIKKLGNRIVSILGGREIHPVNVRVGGLYSLPDWPKLAGLKDELAWALGACQEALGWLAGIELPEFERDYLLVCLIGPEYPIDQGDCIISSAGLDVPETAFEENFLEEQLPHSTALHSRTQAGELYLVGPLARYNLCFDLLSPLAQDAARQAGIEPPCLNPFKSILVRTVELLYALEEAQRLIAQALAGQMPEAPAVAVAPRPGKGTACTEAPRGILCHSYALGEDGLIQKANIVTPTCQNQGIIEDDLRAAAAQNQRMAKDELGRLCETVIRNYDPCISCSTH